MKRYKFLKVLIFIMISYSSYSAPDCSLCTDEAYVIANYSGDIDACENALCQEFVPINDYSYILVFLGGMLTVGMYFKGRQIRNMY
jgi:hypothetical protein